MLTNHLDFVTEADAGMAYQHNVIGPIHKLTFSCGAPHNYALHSVLYL
jgi:hypothetical protein